VEVVALQGLDLQLAEGESIAIAGRSGSGKTTLMNILACVEAPSVGRVQVAGHDLTRMGGAEREEYRRRVVGYLWQRASLNLWPELTALENAEVPMLGAAGKRRTAVSEAEELLEALGIREHRDHRLAQLSGAGRQRLALAVALANRPGLLLADEPTAELDGQSASSLLADLAALLRKLSCGAIMVTHDPQLERYVDRVVQIRDGRTATETRWVHQQGDLVADELVILDRAGRLQLPRHLVEELGLGGRVRVRREGRSLRILAAEDPHA
jgi:ABC-type lipoprotein export system ATPase subunit